MSLIDTHVHVHSDRFNADRDAVLERAAEAGVRRMINIGYDLPSSRASVAIAEQHDRIFATAGIQPHYALETTDEHLHEIVHMLDHPKVVALGEIGLDYHHNRAPHPAQHTFFVQQLDLARRAQLPVVIHSREAHADTVRILGESARNLTIVMHSFSGDWAYAEACLALGAFLSFSGPVTFPKAIELHDVAQRVPLERLLIETDCPYLAPHPHRGKRNEPAFVRLVAERIAALRGVSLETIAAATWANAERAFPKLKAAA